MAIDIETYENDHSKILEIGSFTTSLAGISERRVLSPSRIASTIAEIIVLTVDESGIFRVMSFILTRLSINKWLTIFHTFFVGF